MSGDFPAAHSMDTAWFAVDDDGHVAMFETGESGAVPTAAYVGEEWHDYVEQLEAAAPSSEIVYDLAGMRAAAYRPHVEAARGLSIDAVIAFVRSDDGLAALIARTGATRVRIASSDGVGLLVPKPDAAALTELHRHAVCLGCFHHYQDLEGRRAAEMGLFDYAHATDNAISGPYARTHVPATPLRAADLPPDVARVAIKFPGRFAAHVEIVPTELWACESWEAAWIERDRKTVHAFPGREREARDLVDEVGEHWVLRDPPSARPDAEPHLPRASALRKPWWKLW